jgi:formylglycine-generating enzyme required for sulfatase activity
LYIKLRDGLPGIDPVTNPLGNLNVDGLQFDLSGITIALEGPSIDAAQTYTAFVSALNSVIAATPKAAGLSAAVGTTFTEINTVSASGYYIVITDSFGRSFANNTFTHSTASTASFIELGNFSTSAPATLIDTTTGMVLLKVAGSTYTMGDTFGDGFSGELPTHQVTVGDFYIGKYEVTQGQWQAVMGSNPSYFSSCGTTCPVEQVSWDDIQTFITTLNQRSGKSYRLPTEAEWEYAARSGGKSEKYSGSSDVNAVAWYTTNSSGTTHPAGQKQANGLGLYDMSGNAWEWVNDWYGSYSSTVQTNPTGPTSGSYRVTRGGGWNHDATYARASYRNNNTPDLRAKTVGFRLAAPVQ